jgi:hypothetical protein
MKRRTGILIFVFNLAFWIAPWRALIPTAHAGPRPQVATTALPVNPSLAPPTPLPQGSCVSQAPAGVHGITACWTASASATVTGYNVYTSTTAGGPYAKINTTPVAGTSFFFSTANSGGVKDFIVIRSFDGTAESANSNEFSLTAIGNPLPPTAAQGVAN